VAIAFAARGPYLRSALLHFLLNLEIGSGGGSLWGRFCMRFHFYRGGAACFGFDSDALVYCGSGRKRRAHQPGSRFQNENGFRGARGFFLPSCFLFFVSYAL